MYMLQFYHAVAVLVTLAAGHWQFVFARHGGGTVPVRGPHRGDANSARSTKDRNTKRTKHPHRGFLFDMLICRYHSSCIPVLCDGEYCVWVTYYCINRERCS